MAAQFVNVGRIAFLTMTGLGLALAVACHAPADPPASEPSPAPQGQTTAPATQLGSELDLGTLMRQVHFAFRRDASTGQLAGGHLSYQTQISETGVVRVVPIAQKRDSSDEPLERRKGAALGLETVAIVRGEQPIAHGRATVQLEKRGAVAITRGAAIERIENQEDGAAQSWSFASAPKGQGALEIRVKTSGLAYVEQSPQGLHFANPGSELGLRYSLATWIDADGRRTTIAPRFERGHISITVPAEVMSKAVYPAVLDPIISAEYDTDAPVYVASDWSTDDIDLAFNGTDYLVVWVDKRSGGPDIYGARVGKDGKVLDETGIAICTDDAAQDEPTVAALGSSFLVVWEDGRKGKSTDLYGGRVNSSGSVLDGSGKVIVDTDEDVTHPALAGGTNKWFLTYVYGDWNDDIKGNFITSSLSTSGGFNLDSNQDYKGPPRVAASKNSFLVAYTRGAQDTLDVRAVLVSSEGAIVDSNYISNKVGVAEYAPAVGSDGTDFLVSYTETSGPNSDIHARRVSSAGTVIDSSPIIVTSDGNQPESASDIAFDGTNYVLSWADFGIVVAWHGRIATDGTLLDPVGGITLGLGKPRIETDGVNTLVAINRYSKVTAVRLAPDGSHLDDRSALRRLEGCQRASHARARLRRHQLPGGLVRSTHRRRDGHLRRARSPRRHRFRVQGICYLRCRRRPAHA